MKLLDTPQWDSLTLDEKNHVSHIYGNDLGEGYETFVSPGALKVLEGLEGRGLISMERHESNNSREHKVTLRLREEGWR